MCYLSVNRHVQGILNHLHHKIPKKPQISPHKHTYIYYGSMV